MVHCDNRLKHDRLLNTLIRLFEYKDTGNRGHITILLHTGSNKSCIQQFALFSHNPIQTCLFYIEIKIY